MELSEAQEDTPLLRTPSLGQRSCICTVFVYLGPALGVVAWISIGAAVLVWCLEWQPITALYVITQIVTTIGYGDHIPITQTGKLFVSIYALITILLIGTFITEMMTALIRNHLATLSRVLSQVSGEPDTEADWLGIWRKTFAGLLCFAVFVIVGTVFFGTEESCSCSYGIDRIAGCIDGSMCATTGGVIKTWVDCFYMSIITLTTLGFGDELPESKIGRIFLIPWCLFGTVAMATFAAEFGDAFRKMRSEAKYEDLASRSIFEKIDQTVQGQLTPDEFRIYALLKFEMVTEEGMQLLDELFASIDKDGDGTISYEELERHFDE